MFKRCQKNPIIRSADVRPSAEGYQVVGAFNPGATLFNNEVILLLRVAESCVQEQGKIRIPGKAGRPSNYKFHCLQPNPLK